ncbi:MAG: hypothetical protein ACYTG6_12945, partial [Planctomycetota bacterium]
MRPLSTLLAALALLVGAASLLWFLLADAPPPPQVIPEEIERDEAPGTGPSLVELPKGGVYAGVVVDDAGTPIEAATILLVAFDAGDDIPE